MLTPSAMCMCPLCVRDPMCMWHQGGLAFAEILLLWALILATMALFWRVSNVAAALLLPYLAWVSFAAALTFTTWRLNPGLLG